MVHLIMLALGIVSAILYTVAICSYIGDRKKRRAYSRCTGTILRIIKQRSKLHPGENRSVLLPVISYTVGGKSYEILGGTCKKGMEAGQQTAILYDPEEPSKGVMDQGMYMVSIITAIVGLAFTVALIVVAVLTHMGLIRF